MTCPSFQTPLMTTHTLETAVTWTRSEEHTSELQSQSNLVCRLLLEKKKIPYSTIVIAGNWSHVCLRGAHAHCCRDSVGPAPLPLLALHYTSRIARWTLFYQSRSSTI